MSKLSGWQNQYSNTGLSNDMPSIAPWEPKSCTLFTPEGMRDCPAGGEEGWRPGLCLCTWVCPSAHEGNLFSIQMPEVYTLFPT